MYDEPALIDKVALVFGGSRGIGAAIVRRLAADGASVALTYANSADKATETARAAEAHGRPVIAIKAASRSRHRAPISAKADGLSPSAAIPPFEVRSRERAFTQ